ncbi:putative Meiosis protein mei2 [Paratrimastix pyriformis]|uniref:Meiosis protein mei2 n=1 Tax=Paratrimastix pyriformis TaxID=342808 RepID=A0ABQ8U8T1_9EUKA|nr:putative Meiosis protein mei2 [Paratrimastix pyriformis]
MNARDPFPIPQFLAPQQRQIPPLWQAQPPPAPSFFPPVVLPPVPTSPTASQGGSDHTYSSRTLLVSNVFQPIPDQELNAFFARFGPLRSLDTTNKPRGLLTVTFFDLRDAEAAHRQLRSPGLRHLRWDVHYSPPTGPGGLDHNHGTLVVFNLDPSTTNEDLRIVFRQFGEIKEIRETPGKKYHRFLEFYDSRHAERAMRVMKKVNINGKKVKIEFSRPGGVHRPAPGSGSNPAQQPAAPSSPTGSQGDPVSSALLALLAQRMAAGNVPDPQAILQLMQAHQLQMQQQQQAQQLGDAAALLHFLATQPQQPPSQPQSPVMRMPRWSPPHPLPPPPPPPQAAAAALAPPSPDQLAAFLQALSLAGPLPAPADHPMTTGALPIPRLRPGSPASFSEGSSPSPPMNRHQIMTRSPSAALERPAPLMMMDRMGMARCPSAPGVGYPRSPTIMPPTPLLRAPLSEIDVRSDGSPMPGSPLALDTFSDGGGSLHSPLSRASDSMGFGAPSADHSGAGGFPPESSSPHSGTSSPRGLLGFSGTLIPLSLSNGGAAAPGGFGSEADEMSPHVRHTHLGDTSCVRLISQSVPLLHTHTYPIPNEPIKRPPQGIPSPTGAVTFVLSLLPLWFLFYFPCLCQCVRGLAGLWPAFCAVQIPFIFSWSIARLPSPSSGMRRMYVPSLSLIIIIINRGAPSGRGNAVGVVVCPTPAIFLRVRPAVRSSGMPQLLKYVLWRSLILALLFCVAHSSKILDLENFGDVQFRRNSTLANSGALIPCTEETKSGVFSLTFGGTLPGDLAWSCSASGDFVAQFRVTFSGYVIVCAYGFALGSPLLVTSVTNYPAPTAAYSAIELMPWPRPNHIMYLSTMTGANWLQIDPVGSVRYLSPYIDTRGAGFWEATTRYGGGYDITSSLSYISLNTGALGQPTVWTAWTLHTWLALPALPATLHVMSAFGVPVFHGIELRADNSAWVDTYTYGSISGLVEMNRPFLLTFVRTGASSGSLYINGVLLRNGIVGATSVASCDKWELKAVGTYWEVALIDGAQSATNVLCWYEATRMRFGQPSISPVNSLALQAGATYPALTIFGGTNNDKVPCQTSTAGNQFKVMANTGEELTNVAWSCTTAGLFQAVVTVTKPGSYSLEVRPQSLAGVLLGPSYPVVVSPGPIVPATTRFLATDTLAGALTSVLIAPHDAYGNQIPCTNTAVSSALILKFAGSVPAGLTWSCMAGGHRGTSTDAGYHHHMLQSSIPLGLSTTDTLYSWVWIDPQNAVRCLTMQFCTTTPVWHVAYWGADCLADVAGAIPARVRIGDLPRPARWARLEVPIASLALESLAINRMSFGAADGLAAYGPAGIRTAAGVETDYVTDHFPTGATVGVGALTESWTFVGPLGLLDPLTDSALTATLQGPALFRASWSPTLAGVFPVVVARASDALQLGTANIRVEVGPAARPQSSVLAAALQQVAGTPFDILILARDVLSNEVPCDPVQSRQDYTLIWPGADSPTFICATQAHRVTAGPSLFRLDLGLTTAMAPSQPGDAFYAWVHLDPTMAPQTLVLQWDCGGSWTSPAVWGDHSLILGSFLDMGPLPTLGRWVRLAVGADLLPEVTTADPATGFAFGLAGGRGACGQTGLLHAGGTEVPSPTSPDPTGLIGPLDWLAPYAAPSAYLPSQGVGATVMMTTAQRTAGTDTVTLKFPVGAVAVPITITPGPLDPSAGRFVAPEVTTAGELYAVVASPRDQYNNLIPWTAATAATTLAVPAFPSEVRWLAGAGGHRTNLDAGQHGASMSAPGGAVTPPAGSRLFVWAYLDPDPDHRPPGLAITWTSGGVAHGPALWGEVGGAGATSPLPRMALPPLGRWVRLEVPADGLGLGGRPLEGFARLVPGGRAAFGAVGYLPPGAGDADEVVWFACGPPDPGATFATTGGDGFEWFGSDDMLDPFAPTLVGRACGVTPVFVGVWRPTLVGSYPVAVTPAGQPTSPLGGGAEIQLLVTCGPISKDHSLISGAPDTATMGATATVRLTGRDAYLNQVPCAVDLPMPFGLLWDGVPLANLTWTWACDIEGTDEWIISLTVPSRVLAGTVEVAAFLGQELVTTGNASVAIITGPHPYGSRYMPEI